LFKAIAWQLILRAWAKLTVHLDTLAQRKAAAAIIISYCVAALTQGQHGTCSHQAQQPARKRQAAHWHNDDLVKGAVSYFAQMLVSVPQPLNQRLESGPKPLKGMLSVTG
jgi:hypothetical protein